MTSAQRTEQPDPRCRHHKELDSAISRLRSAAWAVEDAAGDIPDAGEWLGAVDGKTDRQALLDRLTRVAALVHDGHDNFPARWCQREVCIEMRDLGEAIASEVKK